MSPSPSLSWKYGPPMPTKALTWLAPTFSTETCLVGLSLLSPGVLSASLMVVVVPFSKAKLPETWTNSLICTVTKPAARSTEPAKSMYTTSSGSGPVATLSPSGSGKVLMAKFTTGTVAPGAAALSLPPLTSTLRRSAESVSPSMPTSATSPLAFSA